MDIKRDQRNQDLSWFLDMYSSERLELDPPYQRNSVWGSKDKKFFLDTIFNNYPCPAIYLQKEITDSKIIFNVVDGKQRLQTVIDFFENRIRMDKDFPDESLANKRWKDISDNSDLRYRFFNYSFSVEQLRCNGEAQWDQIFNRVNKNQKKLKDQELRHARFNGWLISAAEKEAGSEYWVDLKVSTRGRAKRMQDVEFISILMLVLLENDFVGFPQSRVDELYVKYDFNKEELKNEDELSEDDDYSTPLSTILDFEENFDKIKEQVKQTVNSSDELKKLVSKKALTHLYSIWTLYAFNLDREVNTSEVADKWLQILKKCADFDINDSTPAEGVDSIELHAHKYFLNTKGAATEKGPRIARQEALESALGWR